MGEAVAHAGDGRERVSLIVTVRAEEVLQARRAIFQAGSESVAILKAAAIPHSADVHLCVGMRADALEATMVAIMRSLNRAQFGRVGLV